MAALVGVFRELKPKRRSNTLRDQMQKDVELAKSLTDPEAQAKIQSHVVWQLNQLVTMEQAPKKRTPMDLGMGSVFVILGVWFAWLAIEADKWWTAAAWGVGGFFFGIIGLTALLTDTKSSKQPDAQA